MPAQENKNTLISLYQESRRTDISSGPSQAPLYWPRRHCLAGPNRRYPHSLRRTRARLCRLLQAWWEKRVRPTTGTLRKRDARDYL